MATVRVAVKYTNREFPRVYDISSDAPFEIVKDAVKATGARFDGGFERKWWLATKAGLQALKAAGYSAKPADFEIDSRRDGVVFTPSGETVAHLEVQNRWSARLRLRDEDWDRLARYRDEMQAAYNESDAALAPVLLRIREETSRAVIVED